MRPSAPTGRVLVVDDDPDVREGLREAFEHEGWAARSASNGREALDLLARANERPDAVVLDMMMPIADGSLVWDAMKSDPDLHRIPVIVSTSSPGTSSSRTTRCAPGTCAAADYLIVNCGVRTAPTGPGFAGARRIARKR